MKKRILCLLLAMMMIVGACSALTSCGDETTDCTSHVNEDADGKCDICGAKIKHTHEDEDEDGKCDFCSRDMSDGEEEIIDYPWMDGEKVEILMMMTHADNSEQNPSGCERYLAGEDETANDAVDTLVASRNDAAEDLTHIHPTYKYYPKKPTETYDWGNANELISSTIKSGKSEGIPDIFVNFTYDLLACSLKGCFENIKNMDIKTNGATDVGNYFEFNDPDYDENEDNRGYMYDFMNSTTLSQEKTYIVASDYFMDLIRSFYVMPVNVYLLESVGMEVTGDLNEDGKFTIADFYQEVMEKKWTYNKVAAYSAAVNVDAGPAGDDLEDVLGFAISSGGVAANGVLFSTDIHVIDKVWDDEKGDYEYGYPTTCDTLFDIYDELNTLIGKQGVFVVRWSDPNASKYGGGSNGEYPWLALRTRFCDNKILFGDIIMIGALEFPQYQALNESSGFGVVPVPNYHEFREGERYVTCIHNTSRPGAITLNTKNYTACTAFLNYLSTHSAKVLETYYTINLQYQYTSGDAGTVEMLQYIRLNIRSSFDKFMEDAVSLYGGSGTHSWSNPMSSHYYQYTEMRTFYAENVDTKNDVIDGLYNEYPNLP